MDMIDLEQLRKDMEAGTQGDWIVDETGDTHYIACVPQIEREYIALRKAADALAMVLDAAIKEHDTADYGHDEENPWTMREWFDASDRAALTAYRKATK